MCRFISLLARNVPVLMKNASTYIK